MLERESRPDESLFRLLRTERQEYEAEALHASEQRTLELLRSRDLLPKSSAQGLVLPFPSLPASLASPSSTPSLPTPTTKRPLTFLPLPAQHRLKVLSTKGPHILESHGSRDRLCCSNILVLLDGDDDELEVRFGDGRML